MRVIKLIKYSAQFFYYKTISNTHDYFDVIYQAVKDLGGIYVKLIQFVCLQTDVMPNREKIRFLSFYDEVPLDDINVQQVISAELSCEKMQEFRHIESQPFASGTFGQVYKGELVDGTKIIIKIKRPHLFLKLIVDFFILKIAARVFNLVYYQQILNVNKLVNEFETLTYRELDYLAEAHNAQFFRQIYENHDMVYIPQTYLNLCTKRILVQEYIDGISITSLIRLKDQQYGDSYRDRLIGAYGTDIQLVLKSLAYELAIQGIFYKSFYADPHPGNIKILPNNKYALIDFGIIGTSPPNKRNYYRMISLIVENADKLDMKGLGIEFLKWGASEFYKCFEVLDYYFSGNKNYKITDTIINKYKILLESKRERFREIEQIEKENFAKMYIDIIKAGQNLKVRIPDGLLAMMRTIAVYKSWNEFLEPELHHMRETYQKVLHDVDYRTLVNYEEAQSKKITLEEATEKVLDWIGNIAEFDMPFFTRLQTELKGVSYI